MSHSTPTPEEVSARLRGRSAMERIETDARSAAEIDPRHDGAGPHGVLDTLHRRAPGTPTGVGRVRRALHHLERVSSLLASLRRFETDRFRERTEELRRALRTGDRAS